MDARQVVEMYLAEVLNGAGPASSGALISSEELRQRANGFRRAFPDLEVKAEVMLAEGPFVAGHFVGRGTHHGLFQGVPPTGRSWEARCTAVYRVADHSIAEAWVNWDLLGLMEQLGAVERVQTVSA